MNTPVLADWQKHIHKYCMNAGCHREDLPRATTNCEKDIGNPGNPCYQYVLMIIIIDTFS